MTTPDELLSPTGRLAARLAGWESRPQQMAMANLIAEAIANRQHAIIEAGTGTGKSLAYLVPAILAATADQVEETATPASAASRSDDEPGADDDADEGRSEAASPAAGRDGS